MSAPQQQSEISMPKTVAGRKDRDGAEKVVTLQPLRKKLKHLAALKDTLDGARGSFNAAVKAVAEETGLMSSVITKLIKARSDDKVDDERRKADQLSMVFAEIGGVEHPGRQASFSDSLATGKAVPAKSSSASDDPTPPAVNPMKGTDLDPDRPGGVTADTVQRLEEAGADAKASADRKGARQAKALAGVH